MARLSGIGVQPAEVFRMVLPEPATPRPLVVEVEAQLRPPKSDGRLVTPSGRDIAYHGLLHLLGDDGAEFMAVFTHGELESLDPIVEEVSTAYLLLGRRMLWARRTL